MDNNDYIKNQLEELDKLMTCIYKSDSGFYVKNETSFSSGRYYKRGIDVARMINKLKKDSFLQKGEIIKGGETVEDDYTYQLNIDGVLFLKNGGYVCQNIKRKRQVILNNAWTVAKIIANIANACIVIYLSYLNYKVTWNTKLKDDKIELQDKEINKLKLEIQRIIDYNKHNNQVNTESNTDRSKKK